MCIRGRSAAGPEVALIWRQSHQVHCRTLAEFVDSPSDIMCSNVKSICDLESAAVAASIYSDCELPELLQNLLVSVEHAIERVPLDDLTFPCPQCLQYLPLDRQDEDGASCACQCICPSAEGSATVLKKDMSMQTSPMFEFAGSIPHIDSDEDDEKDAIKAGELMEWMNYIV